MFVRAIFASALLAAPSSHGPPQVGTRRRQASKGITPPAQELDVYPRHAKFQQVPRYHTRLAASWPPLAARAVWGGATEPRTVAAGRRPWAAGRAVAGAHGSRGGLARDMLAPAVRSVVGPLPAHHVPRSSDDGAGADPARVSGSPPPNASNREVPRALAARDPQLAAVGGCAADALPWSRPPLAPRGVAEKAEAGRLR